MERRNLEDRKTAPHRRAGHVRGWLLHGGIAVAMLLAMVQMLSATTRCEAGAGLEPLAPVKPYDPLPTR